METDRDTSLLSWEFLTLFLPRSRFVSRRVAGLLPSEDAACVIHTVIESEIAELVAFVRA